MSFQPVGPVAGYGGWAFLNRTMEAQRAVHDAAPAMSRDLDYFRAHIGKIETAEALVADHRLLKVALGAFGLDDDLPNRFFVRRVLEDGTLSRDALANKLSDPRYKALSRAFGFGDFDTPRTRLSGFADEITSAYKTRQFEIAVGERNDAMRLALNLDRALPEIAAEGGSDETKWLTVMGSKPLREVFETAMGLPQSFGALDLDKQIETFRARAEATLGTSRIDEIARPETRDALLRQFFAREQLASGPVARGPAATALTLLRTAGRPTLGF